jgi:hypothetical protein
VSGGFLKSFPWQSCLSGTEGGDGVRVVTMTREIQQETTKAGGSVADGDGEVVLFSSAAAMEEDDSRSVLAADGRQWKAAGLKLGAQEGAALVKTAVRIWTAEQGRGAVADGESG